MGKINDKAEKNGNAMRKKEYMVFWFSFYDFSCTIFPIFCDLLSWERIKLSRLYRALMQRSCA